MTRANPNSKAGQLRQAERTLRLLLKTPKTRGGLIAAVAKGHVSRNFVFGWLAERRRDGTVTTHKSSGIVMYQIVEQEVKEVPKESPYPVWLDPRSLPVADGRAVYINGKLNRTTNNERIQ